MNWRYVNLTSPDAIGDALDTVLRAPLTEEPSVAHARTINRAISLPYTHAETTIHAVSVTEGDPQHGAKRSDAHVGLWDISGHTDKTMECGHRRARYKHRANHYISGSVLLSCEECDHDEINKVW